MKLYAIRNKLTGKYLSPTCTFGDLPRVWKSLSAVQSSFRNKWDFKIKKYDNCEIVCFELEEKESYDIMSEATEYNYYNKIRYRNSVIPKENINVHTSETEENLEDI